MGANLTAVPAAEKGGSAGTGVAFRFHRYDKSSLWACGVYDSGYDALLQLLRVMNVLVASVKFLGNPRKKGFDAIESFRIRSTAPLFPKLDRRMSHS